MADWKQIQARIRKAKNSSDPIGRLSELFAKTRDGMAAFEIGVAAEKVQRMEEAVHWYTTAHSRFRRPEWRIKATQALERLGAPVPLEPPEPRPLDEVEPQLPAQGGHSASADEEIFAAPISLPAKVQTPTPRQENRGGSAFPAGDTKRRRRGRRGGRGHTGQQLEQARKQGVSNQGRLPNDNQGELRPQSPPQSLDRPSAPFVLESQDSAPVAPPFEPPGISSQLAQYRSSSRSRLADPGISSRLAQLEALLRRLIVAPEHPVAEAEEAPAGPGVFVLSDSDLVTIYYVEPCRTLRVAISNLVKAAGTRGGRGKTSGADSSRIRSRLGKHLGISDAKVTQYMKQHCVVRWLQSEEEAEHLAHLAIAVLRPPLNSREEP